MNAAVLDTPPLAVTELVSARGLIKRFGGVAAVDGVDLTVVAGEALAVIGPNGAGKSTLLKLIAGIERADHGSVSIDGVAHERARAFQIARRGVALARQVPAPFARLTVRENVRVGTLNRQRLSGRHGGFVESVLERCGLADRADRPAGALALLDLKRLELARALSLQPKVLLLDEVAAGLTGKDLESVITLVRGIGEEGISLIIVEHIEAVVRELVKRVVVLDWGKVIAAGTPEEIARDSLVREVYLGTETDPSDRPARNRRRIESPGTRGELVLTGVSAGYGSITALREVDLRIGRGEMIAVLGANGAGKTTLTRVISGLNPATAGTIKLDGAGITELRAHERARRGIAHCQEGRRLFRGLSIDENLALAASSPEARERYQEQRRWVEELFPILAERGGQAAETLSGGQQQMVAIARALMACPRLILFDEISLGLAPTVISDLYDAVNRIRDAGISIALVEQNVHRSLTLADRAYVLKRGQVSFVGAPEELLDEERLESAYFKTGDADLGMATSARGKVTSPNEENKG
ncbi:MAG: ATP-binding cassette domain-containing protein [Actinomycetota bacterium]|nr:ATP-binding cassette domain-containing protein [Actinomycetota bacterium]